MKFSEESMIFLIAIVVFPLLLFGGMGVFSLQQNQLFQQTYNKNLECRQALKDQTVGRVNEICGTVPVIGDFVK